MVSIVVVNDVCHTLHSAHTFLVTKKHTTHSNKHNYDLFIKKTVHT